MSQEEQGRNRKKKEEPGAIRKEPFPGRDLPGREVPLRVSIGAGPWAETLAHAAETPDIEVCGVLVGRLCQDAKGHHVRVDGIVRGERARERGSHVTFTHETWDHIHRQLDTQFPGEQIVGWYHTHPDFGVFLSDMDSFIHTNFFSQPHHVALVRDPIRGQTALFVLRGKDLVALDHFWRDAEPVTLDRPGEAGSAGISAPQLEEIRDLLLQLREEVGGAGRKGWADWLLLALLGGIFCVFTLSLLLGWMRDREYLRSIGQEVRLSVDPATGRMIFEPGAAAPGAGKERGAAAWAPAPTTPSGAAPASTPTAAPTPSATPAAPAAAPKTAQPGTGGKP